MKLSVHVGMGKTGTTALQHFLGEQAILLRNNRCFYLGRVLGRINHGPKLTTQSQAAEPQNLEKALEALEGHAQSPEFTDTYDLVVWSNELLATTPDPSAQIKVISEYFAASKVFTSIEIILGLRRQDTWLEAAYRQWGLMNKLKPGHGLASPEDYAATHAPLMDYDAIYAQWSDAFPVHVATYDDVLAQGGSVGYFCNHWGIDAQNEVANYSAVHVTHGPALSTLYSYFNRAFPAQVKSKLFDKFVKKYQLPELSHDQEACVGASLRQAILNKSAAGNAALAQRLGRDRLFEQTDIPDIKLYETGQVDAISALLRVSKAQSEELDRLRARILKLEKKNQPSKLEPPQS